MENSPREGDRNGLGAAVRAGIEAFARRHGLLGNVLVHSSLFLAGFFVAFLLWFDAGPKQGTRNWVTEQFLPLVPFFLGVKLLLFWRMGLLRGGWRYASIRDIVNILHASWLFVAVAAFSMVVFYYLPGWLYEAAPASFDAPPPDGLLAYPYHYFGLVPQGVLVLDFLGAVFLLCTARLGWRLYNEEFRPVSSEGLRRVLIVGAGDAAEVIIREIHRMPRERYRVIGLVDDDPAKRHIAIRGIPVLGTSSDLRQICEDEEIEEIVIAMPTATRKELQRVIGLCSGTKLKFQSLPSVGDLIDGKISVSQIRPVDINDLLGREAVELDADAVAAFVRGRRVLITGAGGSIGSEMCRQVCHFEPSELILVEQAENPLFDIERELRAAHPDLPLHAVVADILDRERVRDVWKTHRPEVVIHAAAHKHVPLMEANPCEAIKNNVFGSKNVADASCEFGVAEFVMISTDKAVNPSSIMGASKRVAELYTQALNGRPGCRTQFKAVRFGNVLGSAGSVVPIFRKQIAAGGPVTVTHPEMTRYFMTIPEASQLVLQAAATGGGGQIFLLDMGEPVKIVDLARQMITLSGFRPGEDIDITFTGIRPGEKLFEELRTRGEDMEPTVHPKVHVWKHAGADWEQVQALIETCRTLQTCTEHGRIVAALQRFIPEFEPQNGPASAPPSRPAPPSEASARTVAGGPRPDAAKG